MNLKLVAFLGGVYDREFALIGDIQLVTTAHVCEGGGKSAGHGGPPCQADLLEPPCLPLEVWEGTVPCQGDIFFLLQTF